MRAPSDRRKARFHGIYAENPRIEWHDIGEYEPQSEKPMTIKIKTKASSAPPAEKTSEMPNDRPAEPKTGSGWIRRVFGT